MSNEKCYSTDGEYYTDDFTDITNELDVGYVYYEADQQPMNFPKLFSIDDTIEMLNNDAAEVLGECFHGNTIVKNATPEDLKELEEHIQKFIAKFAPTGFYLVKILCTKDFDRRRF